MQVQILSLYTPSVPGVESKQLFFLTVVMLHIKLNGMEHRTSCKHIFCPKTPSTPGWSCMVKISESSHVAYQMEWSIEHHASTYSDLTHILILWVGSKGQIVFFFLKILMIMHIKLKGMELRAPCTPDLWVELKGQIYKLYR